MKFNRSTNITPTITEEINYSAIEETKDESSIAKKTAFKFNKSKKEEIVLQESTKSSIESNAQSALIHKKEINEWQNTQKIIKKFVNKSAKASFGSAVEFSKAPFGLCKRDAKGYRESLDGKLLMNFWTFDKNTNKQINLIPTYIDISEWLNVCHIITSGRLQEMTEEAQSKQKASGYKYCGYIYQSNGGSYKPIYKLNGKPFGGKNNNPIAAIFKITPSNTKNNWVLSSEIYDGTEGETGLIEAKKQSSPYVKIQVLLSYDSLVSIAEMSKMAIQSYLVKMGGKYDE